MSGNQPGPSFNKIIAKSENQTGNSAFSVVSSALIEFKLFMVVSYIDEVISIMLLVTACCGMYNNLQKY